MNKSRIIYLDYLRVFSILAVIMIHVSLHGWDELDANSSEWLVFNFYAAIVRWAVPVFLMISGALFLKKTVSISQIYKKYILRMVTAFAFWSVAYALIKGGTSEEIFRNALDGHYHMWFIKLIIGIYICMPILSKIAENKIVLKYYLVISLLVCFIIPWTGWIINDFSITPANGIMNVINYIINFANVNTLGGYVCYFLLGFYLDGLDLSKTKRVAVYIGGIVGFISTIMLGAANVRATGADSTIYFSYMTVNVLLESIAVFVLFKNIKFELRINPLVSKLSDYSFGAFLVHIMCIGAFERLLGVRISGLNPHIGVPIVTVVVFVVAYIISAVINHVPVVRKYIV